MLSVKGVEALRPRIKPFKEFDAGGLFILVAPSGSKSWRMKYTLDGREKLLSFGQFPIVSLASARQQRDGARLLLADDKDPALERQKVKSAATASRCRTLELVCREWHDVNKVRWSLTHAIEVLKSLEAEIFPRIGRVPVAELTAPLLLQALVSICERGAVETAHRIRQRLEAALDYGAAASGDEAENTARRVRNALPPMVRKGQQPAIIDLADLRRLLDQVENEPAHVTTKLANRLLALTTVRPGTLRQTRWADREFHDLDGPEPLWIIPAARMKLGLERKGDARFDFIAPLSPPAVDVIKTLQLINGRCAFVFPGLRASNQPMSENAVNYLLHRAGFHGHHSSHGWRASFSTIMNGVAERRGTGAADRSIIDLMLGHLPANRIEGAYNRYQYLERRRELACDWAKLLMVARPASAMLLTMPKR